LSPQHGQLECDSFVNIQGQLARVAQRFSYENKRVHIEWIWDGNELWIVQLDHELSDLPAFEPGTPPDTWRVTPLRHNLGTLALASTASRSWSKTECLRVFAKCGLSTGDVLVLEGEHVLAKLAQESVDESLRADLDELIRLPIVIRTDVESTNT